MILGYSQHTSLITIQVNECKKAKDDGTHRLYSGGAIVSIAFSCHDLVFLQYHGRTGWQIELEPLLVILHIERIEIGQVGHAVIS